METFCEGFYAKFLAASGYLTFLFAVVIVVYCVVYESQAETNPSYVQTYSANKSESARDSASETAVRYLERSAKR